MKEKKNEKINTPTDMSRAREKSYRLQIISFVCIILYQTLVDFDDDDDVFNRSTCLDNEIG